MRGEAGERCDAAPVERTELGQFAEKSGENGRADTGDRAQKPSLRGVSSSSINRAIARSRSAIWRVRRSIIASICVAISSWPAL